jgi:ubiquinone/menaquinone biosynthesis C-methylase UbiE/CheY-like chemotaxis protein
MGEEKKMADSPVVSKQLYAASSSKGKMGSGPSRRVQKDADSKAFANGRTLDEGVTPTPPTEKRILVIEPSETIRNKILEILSNAGYIAVGTEDGDEGVKQLRDMRDEIDLVILSTTLEGKGLPTLRNLIEIKPDVLALIKAPKRHKIGSHLALGPVRGALKGHVREQKLLRKVNRILRLHGSPVDEERRKDLEKFKLVRMLLGPGEPPPVRRRDAAGDSVVDRQNTSYQLTLGLDDGQVQPTGKLEVVEKKIQIARAYDAISSDYEDHMEETGHFPAMVLPDRNYSYLFGSTILDIGCGDGYLMRVWARNFLKKIVAVHPDYIVRYLGIDISQGMIEVAERKLKGLFRQEPHLEKHLHAQFLEKDVGHLLKMNLEDTVIRAPKVETVQISYVMHWFVDKDEAARVVSRVLERPEGILRSIEEDAYVDGKGGLTLHITPSVSLRQEFAESVEKEATPIKLNPDMYDLFEKRGLIRIPEYELVYQIGIGKDAHEAYGNIFVNAGQGHDIDYVIERLAAKRKLDAKIRKRLKTVPPEEEQRSSIIPPPPEKEE